MLRSSGRGAMRMEPCRHIRTAAGVMALSLGDGERKCMASREPERESSDAVRRCDRACATASSGPSTSASLAGSGRMLMPALPLPLPAPAAGGGASSPSMLLPPPPPLLLPLPPPLLLPLLLPPSLSVPEEEEAEAGSAVIHTTSGCRARGLVLRAACMGQWEAGDEAGGSGLCQLCGAGAGAEVAEGP